MGREKMIKEIYTGIIQGTKYMDDANRDIQNEIEKLFQKKKGAMDWQDYEWYRDKVFAVTSMAEEAGFIKGFRYAAALLLECFSG